MTVAQWWTNEWWISLFFNVLQGAVGALIGFLGVFWVYSRTRRDERRKISEQRTLTGVVEVIQKASDLRQWGPDRQAQIHALASALLLFAVQERAEHPDVSGWALHHSLALVDWIDDEYCISAAAGLVIGNLIRWVGSDLREKRLTEEFGQESWDEILADAEKARNIQNAS